MIVVIRSLHNHQPYFKELIVWSDLFVICTFAYLQIRTLSPSTTRSAATGLSATLWSTTALSATCSTSATVSTTLTTAVCTTLATTVTTTTTSATTFSLCF